MLSQNPRHADFVLGSCPNCEKVVRIPVTAVTSQSRAQVRCPICDQAFELADVLEDMIPAVEIVDREVQVAVPVKRPERINAIDTPELFHHPRDHYQPITEKKNGRFVVPDLLSKGSRKKKRRRSRRRSRSQSKDPRLAKLKENTSATYLPDAASRRSTSDSSVTEDPATAKTGGEKKRRSRHKRSRKSSIEKIPAPSITRVRSFADLLAFLKACRSLLVGKIAAVHKSMDEPSSRWEYMMIGLGVLFALPILQLVMWWFVGIDPLGLAPSAARVVPFVVPNELRLPGPADGVDLDALEPSRKSPAEIESANLPTHQPGAPVRLPTPKLDPSKVRVDDF